MLIIFQRALKQRAVYWKYRHDGGTCQRDHFCGILGMSLWEQEALSWLMMAWLGKWKVWAGIGRAGQGTFVSRWGKHLQGLPLGTGRVGNVTLPRTGVARPKVKMKGLMLLFL